LWAGVGLLVRWFAGSRLHPLVLLSATTLVHSYHGVEEHFFRKAKPDVSQMFERDYIFLIVSSTFGV
jgi:hypothetical protein